jgi:Histidine kinase-, DNA gyrase B-, and HSP90-like ATPase
VTAAPRLERATFRTSRLLDFMSEKELTFQCGFGRRDWPLVVAKELIDNALDACEEQGIAPELDVTIDESGITVADNGTGIAPDTVERLLDFSVRVSSREAYVAPDRGAQGNALKTIVAMPFVLDGERGRVDICGGGVLNEIEIAVDRLRQRPKAEVVCTDLRGSFVRVHWPVKTVLDPEQPWYFETGLLDRDDRRFLQVASDFTFLNPHLTLRLDWFGERSVVEATNPTWSKWTPASPTSPHWYRPEDLERLIAAYLVFDQDNGRDRTVREFVAEFRGLTSTIKQKAVLAATGCSRAPLSSLANETQDDVNKAKIAALLASMRERSTPVKPRALGTIGRGHLEQRFASLGIVDKSFQYSRKLSVGADGLPQVTETAFAALADGGERRLVTGVNWSAGWANPFRQLGEYGRSLDSELSAAFAGYDEPVVLLVHVAHPRVQYTDRAKSTVLAHG